jgi:hypothetical protein
MHFIYHISDENSLDFIIDTKRYKHEHELYKLIKLGLISLEMSCKDVWGVVRPQGV